MIGPKSSKKERDAEMQESCKDEGRDWSDVPTRQGTPSLLGPPEAGEGKKDPPLQPSEGEQPC